MKRLFPLLLTLLLFPLPGCGLGNGIPRGLDWQALTVTDQKGGALLSAAPGWEGGKDVPRLSLSVQVASLISDFSISSISFSIIDWANSNGIFLLGSL